MSALQAMFKKFNFEQHTCEKHGTVSRVIGEQGCPSCELEQVQKHAIDKHTASLKQHRIDCANIPARYKTEEFIRKTEEQKRQASDAWAFAQKAAKGWAACILSGRHGNGKTLLACRLIVRFINEYALSARYTTCKGIVSEIRKAYKTEGMTEASQIEKMAMEYDLLVIDEADVLGSSENEYALIAEVIGMRYANSKPIIVISNKTPQELEEVLGERIMSRLSESNTTVIFNGEDYRRASC